MERMSIFETITANLDDDFKVLPGFSLEFMGKNREFKCAAGMHDGTLIYHTLNLGNPGDPQKAAEDIAVLLVAYFADKNKKFLNEIDAILNENSVISIVDDLAIIMWDRLFSLADRTDWKSLAHQWRSSSIDLLINSDNMNFVKIGITLLGVLGFTNFNRSADLLFNIGVYDELTIYALTALSRLADLNSRMKSEQHMDFNAIVFEIAKRVNGWGRVHAVKRLEPATDEIRGWILRKGCLCPGLVSYLALTCAESGDMISALRQETLDDELFKGVSAIMEALIEEESMPGISVYTHADEALALYRRNKDIREKGGRI